MPVGVAQLAIAVLQVGMQGGLPRRQRLAKRREGVIRPFCANLLASRFVVRVFQTPDQACDGGIGDLGQAGQLRGVVAGQIAQEVQRELGQTSLGSGKVTQDGAYTVKKRDVAGLWRSEEHTSELQSRENLVCRLL